LLASVAAGGETWHAFVSHPGELKKTVVASLKDLLDKEHKDLKVFVDEWDLNAGDRAPAKMIKACGTARVGQCLSARPWPRPVRGSDVRPDWSAPWSLQEL
jgi:hypothetical protein